MLAKAVNLSKQVYSYGAMLALLNLGALLAVVAYLGLTGAVQVGDVQKAVAALRGETPVAQPKAVESASKLPIDPAQGESLVDNLDAQAQMDIEILHREAQRVKVELEQRLALNKSILLQVENERDAFRREKELEQRRQQEAQQQSRDEGFEKQVEIYRSLNPKVAVQHLLSMSSPDEAARILTALEPERARKIIEAARREPELSQMQVVLQRVRETGGTVVGGGD